MQFRFIGLILGTLLVCSSVQAQQTDFERFRQQQREAFQQYVSEQDRRFADFLRKEWKQVDLQEGEEILEDKPADIPVFEPIDVPLEASDVPSAEMDDQETPPAQRDEETGREELSPEQREVPVDRTDVAPPVPERVEPPAPPPVPLPAATIPVREPASGSPVTEVTLFGTNYPVIYAEAFRTTRITALNNNAIADYWLALAGSPYQPAVADLKDLIETYKWNDWAAAVFIRRYADSLTSNENTQTALTWFLLNKVGYTVHVGYHGNRLVLIAPATTRVYAVPRYTMEGSRLAFYMMDYLNRNTSGIRSIHTYAADDAAPEASLELFMRDIPLAEPSVSERTVRFATLDRAVEATIRFDNNKVDFFRTYPQTELGVFFNAAPSAVFESSVRAALEPLLEGRSQGDQLNILLRFVQTAFEYKTDTQQFGRQRFMTPDEIMFYPYSDCDDRAILFAYLVRTLLGLEVIGLEYSTHVATAVRADASLQGDRIVHNGNSYLVCDPTYIMADYGMTMPQFRNERPSVIPIF